MNTPSTTNPWVVGALVKLCLEAGAASVSVFDFPFADIKVDDSGLVGDRLDLTSMLGVEDDKAFPSVEVFMGHGRHLLTLAYTAMDYSGSAILTQKIVFNGQTFAVGSQSRYVPRSQDVRCAIPVYLAGF